MGSAPTASQATDRELLIATKPVRQFARRPVTRRLPGDGYIAQERPHRIEHGARPATWHPRSFPVEASSPWVPDTCGQRRLQGAMHRQVLVQVELLRDSEVDGWDALLLALGALRGLNE